MKLKFIIKSFLLTLILFVFFSNFSLAATCEDAGGFCETTCSTGTLPGAYDHCPNGEACCAESSTATPPSAVDYSEGSTGSFLLLKGHLVPCGRKTNDSETANNETAECTLCHLFLLLKNIFDLVLSLVIITAILFLTIGGVIYIVSTGNPNLTGIAKNIIKKTLTGFALMMVGWLIIYTLLVFLSANNMIGTGGKWFEFDCESESRFEPGTTTVPTPPGSSVSGDEESNRSRLAGSNITVNKPVPTTEVAGLTEDTLQDLISFQSAYGLSLVVTGGSESSGGHASGVASHGNGQKVDLRLSDSLTSYIESNFTPFTTSRTDVSAAYTDGNGNYYYLESDHWDVCYGSSCKQI